MWINRKAETSRRGRVGVLASFLILATFFIFLYPSHAKEPTFPGRGAGKEKLADYWNKFGKYVMENAPEDIKKGGDVEKGKYVFGQVGDKLASLGIEPNTTFGDRVKGLFRPGPRDQGACGDITNTLSDAFSGARIKNQAIVADKNSLNVFDVNRDHGAPYIIDKEGKIKMFDLWEHGKEKGKFAGGASSIWNGMDGKDWGRKRSADGYKEFKKEEAKDNPGTSADNLFTTLEKEGEEAVRFDNERKRRSEEKKERDRKKEADQKAEQDRKKKEEEARQKAALQNALKKAEELISAVRTAINRAQTAIAAAKAAASSGNTSSEAARNAHGAFQRASGAFEEARSAHVKIVSEGVIDAARMRAVAAANKVKAIYEEIKKLASETCMAAIQVQQASNTDAKRIFETKAEALAQRVQIRASLAKVAIDQAKTEAAKAIRQNADRQAVMRLCEVARQRVAEARAQLGEAEVRISEAATRVNSGKEQLEVASSAASQAEKSKAGAMGILSPFASEPEAQAKISAIQGMTVPTTEGIDQELKAALEDIQKARGNLSKTREQLGTLEGRFSICDALTSTDSITQEASAAATAAESFLPKITAGVAQSTECLTRLSSDDYNPLDDPNLRRDDQPVDLARVNREGDKFQEERPGGRGRDWQEGSRERIPQPDSYTGDQKPPEESKDIRGPTYPLPPPPDSGRTPADDARDLVSTLPPPSPAVKPSGKDPKGPSPSTTGVTKPPPTSPTGPSTPTAPQSPQSRQPSTVRFQDSLGKFTIVLDFPNGEGKSSQSAKVQDGSSTYDVVEISVDASDAWANISVLGSHKGWRMYGRSNLWDRGPQARRLIDDPTKHRLRVGSYYQILVDYTETLQITKKDGTKETQMAERSSSTLFRIKKVSD